VYGFLSPERASLSALIPDRTIFVSSVSKSLFPGMRLGCVVAPAGLLEKLSVAVWTTTICVPPISADLLCGWMDDGTALRILEWKRHEVAARQTMVKRLLGGYKLITQPSSPHVWLYLPTRWTTDAFAAEMRSRGVLVNASTAFTVGDQTLPRAVRLCIGTPRTRAGLEQALTRISEALSERAPAARAVV
jgi:DNA-binding transcriptional MocR family regulator